jgi:NADPH-dependent ferric siderophore reductase
MDATTPSFQMRARPVLPQWRLTVENTQTITPGMQRIRFTGADLETLQWTPGQDLVLNLPDAPRRHYTIRAKQDRSLDIDFVLHGHGAAAAWAKGARIGDAIEAVGPRGRTSLVANADWHLFLGDETCIPAILAMLEILPKETPATAFIEVASAQEQQEVSTTAKLGLNWIIRGGPAQPNSLLLDQLKAFQPPAGLGHAYVIGETSGVRAQRHYLLEQGWAPERITAEGYWRPGRVGGHDHV